jgi:hypothetical protein
VTKATYRKLRAVWWIGSAVLVGAVVAGWLRMIPFGLVSALIIVVGGAAAFAGWVLRDQNLEELPD